MIDTKKLEKLLEQQDALMHDIACEAEKLKGDSTVRELEHLKAEHEELKKRCDSVTAECEQLRERNITLKDSLHEHLVKEKRSEIGKSYKKMNLFFGESVQKDCSKLEHLEKITKKRIAVCSAELDEHMHGLKEKFYPKISALENEIALEIDILKKEYKDYEQGVEKDYKTELQNLASIPLPHDSVEEVLKPPENKIEMVLGLKILASIGAIFIVLGVIVLSVFLHERIHDLVNTAILFSAAALVLGLGIFINRQKDKRTIFTHTILAIGVGLQYTALAISYFAFEALNMWAALGICVVITAISYLIAVRLKSEIVAVFAQIGGYLPIITLVEIFFAYNVDLAILYGAMVYFIILSVLGFLLSSRHKWQVLNYISFGLNIIATIFVAASVGVIHETFGLLEGITLGFMFVSFGIHTLLPVFTNINLKKQFTGTDFLLITLTTAINLILFYIMFAVYSIDDWSGFLSLFFAAFYIGLYFLVRTKFKLDFSVRTLFWSTALVFLILFMPMQFNIRWISFGWVLQGAVLVIYGILKNRKVAFTAGFAISIIAVIGFIIMDVFIGNFAGTNTVGRFNIFVYKYLFVTLSSIVVLIALIYKRKLILGYIGSDRRYFIQNIYKNPSQAYAILVYLNACGFLLYCVFQIFYSIRGEALSQNNNIRFFMFISMLVSLFFMGVALPKWFKAKGVCGASIGVSLVSLMFMFVVMCFRLPVFNSGEIGSQVGMGIAVTATVLVSMYVFYDLYIRCCEMEGGKGKKSVVIALAGYFLFWYSFILMWQFRIHFSSIAITIAYIVVAFVCIGLGLYMRSASTRRFALVVAGIAIVKLFVIDILALNISTIAQVILFISFGVAFLGMGFLYQVFYKRFAKTEKDGEGKIERK